MSVNVIHILGASGCGTSTLGQALERQHGYKWLDTDHFFWFQTHLPFTSKRHHEERIPLMAASIEENPKCVISGSLCGWGDVFIPKFDIVVFIYTPADIRMERLRKREHERHGDRILKGGDMYGTHLDFLEWAMAYDAGGNGMRSLKMHEEWLKSLDCPIIRLDGTDTCEQHLMNLEGFLKGVHGDENN